jgi:hypothetical protein
MTHSEILKYIRRTYDVDSYDVIIGKVEDVTVGTIVTYRTVGLNGFVKGSITYRCAFIPGEEKLGVRPSGGFDMIFGQANF